MAISLNAAGSWAYAASGSVTPTLPSHATGDMLLVRVAYKSSAIATCAASTATAGWTKLGEFHSGTTNSGANVGSVAVALFYKEAASAAEGNPTIDFSQTVTQVGHVALSYAKGSTEGWLTPVGDGGGEEVADTGKSFSIASHVSVTAADMVDIFFGTRDDTTVTVPTFTQAGVTFAAVSEQPATAGTVTTGDDMAFDGAYRLASSGTSSAAAVLTCTLSTSEWAAGWQTRLRVQVATDAAAENAAGTGTAHVASSGIDPTAGNSAGAGAAFQASANVQPLAAHASGTGTAYNATVSAVDGEEAPAGHAAGTGTANQASAGVDPNAGNAAGVGTAYGPAADVGATATLASGTGTAYDATVSVPSGTNANAGLAAGAGSAYGASISIAAGAGNAIGTGSAFGPTVSVGGATINWHEWSDTYSNPVGVAGGHGGRQGRRPVKMVRVPLTPITGTVAVVMGHPEVVITADVNDDEVVLEILAAIL
jgi:hypothetical protein